MVLGGGGGVHPFQVLVQVFYIMRPSVLYCTTHKNIKSGYTFILHTLLTTVSENAKLFLSDILNIFFVFSEAILLLEPVHMYCQ